MRFAPPNANLLPAFGQSEKNVTDKKADQVMSQSQKKSSQKASEENSAVKSQHPNAGKAAEEAKVVAKPEPAEDAGPPMRAAMPMRTRGQRRNQSRDISEQSKSSAESEESADLFDMFHGKATKKQRQKKQAQQQLSKSTEQGNGKKEQPTEDLPKFGNAASKQLNRSAATND